MLRDMEQLPPHTDAATWQRFCASVLVIPGGCHLWTGPADADGHGRFWADGRIWPAHRYAWSAWHGHVSRAHPIAHRCGHPLCAPITLEAVDVHLTDQSPQETRTTLIHHREAGRRRLAAARQAHLEIQRATRSASLDAVLAAAIENANGTSDAQA